MLEAPAYSLPMRKRVIEKIVKNGAKGDRYGLRDLYKIGLKLLLPLSLEETYMIVAKEAKKFFNAEFCSIFLKSGSFMRKSGRIERVYSTSPKLFKIETRKTGFTFRASQSKKPSVVNIRKIELVHPETKDMGIKNVIFIPLVFKNNSVGVLSLDSFEERNFGEKDFDIMTIFGSLSTMAIRKGQLHNELQESLETRDLFISLASHELRTPLTTISSYIQLMEKTVKNGHPIEKNWVEILSQETKRLILLTNELLHTEQIKKGILEYNWQVVNLREVIDRSTLNFRIKFPKHKLIFEDSIRNQPKIMGDFDKLIQAFLNILSNSGKFSPPKSSVLISLSEEQAFYNIRIKDQGVGIQPRERGKIFEKYYQASNSKKGGLGLGLFLTKSIVKMHSGKIRMSSSPGQGTVVELKLPKLQNA